MKVQTVGHFCRLRSQKRKPVLYIDYLETAPWNIKVLTQPLGLNPQFGAVGTRMNTDEGWLRRKAEQEDGCFVSVGGLMEALAERAPSANVVPMKTAFVHFVQLTRRVRRLSLEEFAEKTDVDLAELMKIETQEHYKTTLLTVHKIANFLEVPEQKLLALAGL